MTGNGNVIAVYIAYLAIAVGLTIWLARTLFRSGQAFLDDVFEGRPEIARSVNRLLVVGFYMLNLGYALWVLRTGRGLDAIGAVEFLVNRLAVLLISLSILHFFNVFLFWTIRTRREQRSLPHPFTPRMYVPPPPPAEL